MRDGRPQDTQDTKKDTQDSKKDTQDTKKDTQDTKKDTQDTKYSFNSTRRQTICSDKSSFNFQFSGPKHYQAKNLWKKTISAKDQALFFSNSVNEQYLIVREVSLV